MQHNIINVTDTQFDQVIKAHQFVLVDFWAPWCGPCLQLAPILEQVAALYKGKVLIAKLDISEYSETSSRYSISTIPTMLFFHQGKNVDRLVGNLPISKIQASLDRYLS